MRGRKLSFERLEGKKLLAVHTIPDLAICSSLTSQVDDEWLIFASNTNCLTLRPLFGSGEYPYIGDLFMTDGTDGSPKLLARFEEHGWILNKEARDAIGKVYDLDGNEVMLGDEEVRLNIGFGGLRFRSAVGSRFLGQLPYPGCDGGNACVKQPSLENEPKQVGDFVVSYDSGRFFRTDAGGNEILLADFTCEAGSIAAGDINMTVLGDHVLLSITGGGELSSTSFMMDMQDDYHPPEFSWERRRSRLRLEAGPEPELSDSQYRWDLDGDGFFDDAVGQRIHLSRSLQEFGFVGGQERLVALRVRDIFSCGIATDMVRFIDESAGDLTDDGRVTFDDFLILSQNFGKRDVNQSQGDLNNDDEINFLDFLIMSTNFETDDS